MHIIDYAVMVAFHLHHLDELEPGFLYKYQDSKNKKQAVAAVIGFDLEQLEKEYKTPDTIYIREDGEEMHIIESFLCDQFGVEAITSKGNRITKLGSIHPGVLSEHGWKPDNGSILSSKKIGKHIEPELIEGYHFVGKIAGASNGELYIEKCKILQVYEIVKEEQPS